MKEIQLTRGYVALVDDEDYEWLSQWNWCVHVGARGELYAHRRKRSSEGRGHVLMHRLIMGAPDGQQVDHIDRDGLNNQKGNLRLASRSMNSINRGVFKNNTSGYRGVGYVRHSQKWRARIDVDGVQTYLGIFDSPEAAARAYDKAALELHGSLAQLNFPEEVAA